ncbi:MAG: hypothetical protein KKD28_05165, partial [Chloroflexi bacterium]|nr:hypothetical protein [Chloroflexota bacterium]
MVIIGILGGMQSIAFILMWSPWQKTVLGIFEKYEGVLIRFRVVGILQALISAALLPFLTLGPTGKDFADMIPRLWIFWAAVLGVAIVLKTWAPESKTSLIYAVTIIGVAVFFKLAAYIPDVSTYPFSLAWSESNRYYYASLLFSQKIWGRDLPLSPWHPSRYMLQSLPFLISGLPLWIHRLWQVLLWVLMPVLSGIALARRLPLRGHIQTSMFIAWVFLFFSQGPVYYHLHICLIIILLGFDSQRFWRSLILVVIASIWAGISRVNWVPVPAFIAGAIYLIEMPVNRAKNIREYLSRPFFWSLAGGVAAVLSQMAYVNLSGNDVTKFGSSFTSNLLWYRLWPNETFKPGILPAILLVSAPLLLVIIFHLRQTLRVWHPIRILGLGAILLTLFVGGLAVSVKIGGGSNLHNLDAYIVLLLIVGAYLYYGQFSPETPTGTSGVFRRISNWVLGFAIGVPVCLSLLSGVPVQSRNSAQVENALQELRRTTSQAAMAGEDVLFISNRHLLLFDLIPDVPL